MTANQSDSFQASILKVDDQTSPMLYRNPKEQFSE